ncbi:MAG: HDOD domain-containing protein [Gammaproteobacteria bacterium]|jgi:HD-like signal output (HDOD) protein
MNTAEKQAQFPNKIAEIESLPPFPLLANIIKAFITAENDGEIRPLIDNIETEPSIVAKIIGVANSAAFGNQTPVRSIKDAIIKLGVIQLKTLVFSIVVGSRFNGRKCPAFDSARFWQDSMFLAYCTSIMVEHCKNVNFNRNQVYSIGLVLRIGMLALVHIAPKEMHDILHTDNIKDLLGNERAALHGIDHFDAGAILLKHWQLPQEYSVAAAYLSDESYAGPHLDTVILLRRAKELLRSDFLQSNPLLDQHLGLTTDAIELIAEAFENDKSWILSFSEHL